MKKRSSYSKKDMVIRGKDLALEILNTRKPMPKPTIVLDSKDKRKYNRKNWSIKDEYKE